MKQFSIEINEGGNEQISLRITDHKSKTIVELSEDECEELSGFNMFSLGKMMIKIIKPKFQKIIEESKSENKV